MKLTVLRNSVPISDVQVETPDLNDSYEIFVGRSEDCHVLIDDPLISRHHFVLRNEGAVWYCDKLTTLGTVSINGIIASNTKVSNGDEIKCGNYSVLVSDLPVQKINYEIPVAQPVYLSTPAPEPVIVPVQVAPIIEEVKEEEPVSVDEFSEESEGRNSSSEDEFSNNDFSDSNDLSSETSSEESVDFNSGNDPADFGSMSDGGDLIESDNQEMDDQDEKTSVFRAFVNYQLVLFGEHAPYDRYLIESEEVYIGRDPKKCQIILNDPEVSTVHAVIRKNNVDITLEDLNSSNGTILNAERINKAHIVTGDEFVIGSTSFTLEVKSDLLEAESGRLMPVEEGQFIEHEEIHEEEVALEDATDINFTEGAVQEKSIIKRVMKDPKLRMRAIIGLVVLAGLWLMMDEEPKNVPKEAPKAEAKVEDKNAKPKLQLSKELEDRRNIAYELGVSFLPDRYAEALREFQIVASIDPDYKNVQSYLKLTQAGLKRLEELEAQKRAEEERLKLKIQIEELLVKAREAVKEKNVAMAESYFNQITEKDPENMEVPQLKMELEAWQREQERIALEKAAKEAARKAMVDALNPGKTFYLKKEWYRAILKLEEFLRRKGTDEDLVKEASEMLADSKNQLASELGPLLGKARSLKEGQDLRNAYEAYLDILKIEPTNTEALNEVDAIKTSLEERSKRIYREAIIAESLSLFTDAKEKFLEVQQISPTDSEYFKKASEKLKNYLE